MLRGVLIYLLAALFLFYEMALQVSPSVMTHQLMKDFHIHASLLGLMASFYFYSYTLMQIPAGLLYDRVSPRLLIPGATLICALGAFAFGSTHDIWAAAFGRLLMGVGSAFAFIGVLVVASRWFQPTIFAFLVGVAQFLAALGAMGGELPLSEWVNATSWREVMIQLGLIGLVLAAISVFVIKDRPHSDEMVGIKRALKEVLKRGQTWWIALYAFMGWTPVAVFGALWGVPFFMAKYSMGHSKAAFAISILWLGIALAAPIIGKMSDRIGRRKILIQATSLIGLFASIVMLYFDIEFVWAVICCFLFGVASAGQILSFALVRDNQRPAVVGAAIGFNNMALVAGGAIVQPIVGLLLTLVWDGKMVGQVPIYSLAMYEKSLFLVPVIFFLGFLVITFGVKETFCKNRLSGH